MRTRSVQETLFKMGTAVRDLYVALLFPVQRRGRSLWSSHLSLTRVRASPSRRHSIPEVASIRLSMPNIHYIPFKHLSNLGLSFNDDIYLPTSEPAGAIVATVSVGCRCPPRGRCDLVMGALGWCSRVLTGHRCRVAALLPLLQVAKGSTKLQARL